MIEAAFDRLAIIGLGLIGGSLAAAVRQQGLARELTAWDPDPHALNLGRDLGIVDTVAPSIRDACEGADLIIVAVPVQSSLSVFKALQPLMNSAATKLPVLTDVGSVKSQVLEAAREVFGEVPSWFVPGHPIAGSEQHGVAAANPALFQHHRVILTPLEATEAEAIAMVTRLWQGVGAEVIAMTPEHHDAVLAQTSHLPHLLAYALVDTLSSGGDSLEVFQYAAGGFRDFSRIAASDPTMWSDIFQANQGPVLDVLDRFLVELGDLRVLIEQGDGDALKQIFERAKQARDHFSSIDRSGRSE